VVSKGAPRARVAFRLDASEYNGVHKILPMIEQAGRHESSGINLLQRRVRQ
jgi:hypothetical protein